MAQAPPGAPGGTLGADGGAGGAGGAEDEAEVQHFREVVASMRHYYHCFRPLMLDRMHRHHCKLTAAQVALLPGGADGITRKLDAYEAALHENQLFYDAVLIHMNEAPSLHTDDDSVPGGPTFNRPLVPYGQWRVPAHHATKLSGTLHAVARDWAHECAPEREEAYAPLLRVLRERLPAGARVLVPGSGLARLACEAAGLGLRVQGNDFDYFMLFAADFMLNGCSEPLPIHPWVHSLCNNLSHSDAVRRVDVPDVSAHELLTRTWPERAEHRDFSMCAGEFTIAYPSDAPAPPAPPTAPDPGPGAGAPRRPQPGRDGVAAGADAPLAAPAPALRPRWDCVCCAFFIDVAPNVLDFVQHIWCALEDGGLWLSLGPLQYHWADPYSALSPEVGSTGPDSDAAQHAQVDGRYHQSLELSWEELRFAIAAKGFVFEHEELRLCHYTLNHRSMHRTQYNCMFFVARKAAAAAAAALGDPSPAPSPNPPLSSPHVGGGGGE